MKNKHENNNKKNKKKIMSKKNITILAIIGLLLIIVFWIGGTYNSLVKKNESCNSQWSKVESQYQRRMDLIPNLVSVVKGYAKHESETLLKVVQARNQAMNTPNDEKSIGKYQTAQNNLTSALRGLNIIIERYPDLKANQNFLELQSQLEGTENRIAVERQRYSDMVQKYNQKIKSFPTNIIAGMFNFSQKEYYQADKGSDKAPKVEF